MGSVLANKDVNAALQTQDPAAKAQSKTSGAKTLEQQRQRLQSKMEEEKYGSSNATSTITTTTIVAAAAAAGSSTTAATKSAVTTHEATAPLGLFHHPPNAQPSANLGDAADGRNKQQYISPSDNIMSPCTAKLSALKGRQMNRIKPKSLFAQSSAKALAGKAPRSNLSADGAAAA
ncbi:hypothetical protein GGS23DRAFT_597203 [Durotheca rogersii]|uniref:uncharacterized protein n=1 Tax=Durotheca rogersii TaxID=419775 RepID=UPI00221F07A6|nr:uncharacterized protein GGS23DRAFT_597203 [Durotheca rogersii]KAI5862897.1 hypothetical protein GGS23DRAFT_597203 [Durotheca rogersii]